MCVAAGIIVAAAVGAVGSAVAGHEAAGATQAATNAAVGVQQQALNQQAQLAAPYTGLGQQAIGQYESLLGISPAQPNQGQQFRMGPNGQMIPVIQQGPGGNNSQALSTLENTPGYQFAQQQGTQGTVNAATAMGLGLSGNTLQGLSQFNQGLASQTYQNQVQDLEAAVGIGQAAAAGQATNIGSGASNISNALINQGNNLAGIDANTIAGLTKGIGGAANNYMTLQTLNALGGYGGGYGGGQDSIPGVTGSTGAESYMTG